MTLTRQHFQMIAEVVSDPTLHLTDAKRRAIATRFADKLYATNARFDRDRFMRACGVK